MLQHALHMGCVHMCVHAHTRLYLCVYMHIIGMDVNACDRYPSYTQLIDVFAPFLAAPHIKNPILDVCHGP